MAKRELQSEPDIEINGLRDLTPDQREDIEALCSQGYLPSQISRKLGIPTRVCADARRSWLRQEQLEDTQKASVTVPASSVSSAFGDPVSRITQMLQDQMQQQLLQAQIERLQEDARHRKESNRLDEQERAQMLRERQAQFREDYPDVLEEDEAPTIETPSIDTTGYDFENDPVGTVMRFIADLAAKKEAQNVPRIINPSPDAPQSPTIDSMPDLSKPLTQDQIAALVARTPPETVKQARGVLGTPLEGQIKAGLIGRFPHMLPENADRVVAWLKVNK